MGSPVYVNVYDLSPINDYMFPFGLGAYHSGIQVHGKEYTFGSGAGDGVFSHEPKKAPQCRFRVQIHIGNVSATSREVERVVDSMRPDWHGSKYHVMKCNCNSFSDELCRRLTGMPTPGWVNRLSYIGNSCSCLIPDSMINGGQAPVTNGSNSSSSSGGPTAGSVFRTGNNSSSRGGSGANSGSSGAPKPGGSGHRLGGSASSGAGGASSATSNTLYNDNGTAYDSAPGGSGAGSSSSSWLPFSAGGRAGRNSAAASTSASQAGGGGSSGGAAGAAAARTRMLEAAMKRVSAAGSGDVQSNPVAEHEDDRQRLMSSRGS